MRRLRLLVAGCALAAAGLTPVMPVPPAAAACGTEDPTNATAYTLAWYACRRSETPDPDLLPALDTTSGNLTVCVGRYKVHGSPKSDEECGGFNMLGGSVPTRVCMPPTTGPIGQAVPCIPLPEFGGGNGEETPGKFPYEDFQVCTPDGTTCRATFWSLCVVADSSAHHLACAGAGVQFLDRKNPGKGIDRICIAVGTPMDPPNTWTIACAPVSQEEEDTKPGRGRGNGQGHVKS